MDDGLLGDLSDDEEEVMRSIALQKSLLSESQSIMRSIECEPPHDLIRSTEVDTASATVDQEETRYCDALAAHLEYNEFLGKLETNLKTLIADCKTQLDELTRTQKEQHTVKKGKSNYVSIFGAPFFKDKDFYPCPPNSDTLSKIQHDELCWVDVPAIHWWRPAQTQLLVDAIADQSKEACKQDAQCEKSALIRRCKALEEGNEERSVLEEKIQNFNIDSYISTHLSEKAAAMDYDWMQLSATVLKGKHSADECRGFWQSVLHPKFSKGSWEKEEDSRLWSLAEEKKCQNWNLIAEELGTARSGYQCFCQYYSVRNTQAGHKWTTAEDEQLKALVDKLRIGDFIPWGQVTMHIKDRSKTQVYNRWSYSLDPKIKRGRFTLLEDIIILRGIQKWGQDFHTIASYMPDRTAPQLRLRFVSTLSKLDFKPWTTEEDDRLLDLVQNNEGQLKWSKMAEHFPGKTGKKLRDRHLTLKRRAARADLGRPQRAVTSRRNSASSSDPYSAHPELWDHADKLFSGGNLKDISVSLLKPKVPPVKRPPQQKRVPEIDGKLGKYFRNSYFSPTSNKFKSLPECDPKFISNVAAFLELLRAKLSIPSDECLEEDESLNQEDRQLLKGLRSAHPNVLEAETPLAVTGNDATQSNFTFPANLDYVQPSDQSSTEVALDSLSGSFPPTSASTLDIPELGAPPAEPEKQPEPDRPLFGDLEYLCPPNISTLVGLRSILLAKDRLVQAVSTVGKGPILYHGNENEAFLKARQLWEDRLLTLFAFPNTLTKIKSQVFGKDVPVTSESPPLGGSTQDVECASGPSTKDVFDVGKTVSKDGDVLFLSAGKRKPRTNEKQTNQPKKRARKS